MLPKSRLGKRSPLGTLVSALYPAGGALAGQETSYTGIAMATGAGHQSTGRDKGHPSLKLYFQCGGAAEPSTLSSDHCEPLQTDVSARPTSVPSSSSRRSVSSSIDVPRSGRSPEEVDMDELMAAMVLSSLSCSPLLHSPAHQDTAVPPMDCGGSELSDGGSSGYWSVGHGAGSPEPAVSPATPPDEGLDMEMEQVLFDEPAARKRRNSAKAAYRCLWPSCDKVLTTVVGIKRHIRTTHLGRGSDHERCSRSEEDFYYTEINQWEQQMSPPLPVPCSPAPPSPSSSSPSSPPSPPPPSPPSPASPTHSALSRSAPSSSGSSWQVQSEHSYQAPPPSHVTASALNTPSCGWMAPPSGCLRQGLAFRARSVSVGEQWLQQHSGAPCRRIRGEAKKCRKVYGIEHREQWCTACRWKKACQRFQD